MFEIRERRVLGPDARIEVAVDDTRAGVGVAAHLAVDRRGADEVGAGVGQRLAERAFSCTATTPSMPAMTLAWLAGMTADTPPYTTRKLRRIGHGGPGR